MQHSASMVNNNVDVDLATRTALAFRQAMVHDGDVPSSVGYMPLSPSTFH